MMWDRDGAVGQAHDGGRLAKLERNALLLLSVGCCVSVLGKSNSSYGFENISEANFKVSCFVFRASNVRVTA